MKKILLAEDSQMFGKIAKNKIEDCLHIPVCWARSLAEVNEIVDKENGDFLCALLDYHLPDSPDGEVIDKVVSQGITSFVFTSSANDEVREHVWSKKVADYISKEDPNSMEYIITAIKFLERNRETLILVVDDSKTTRTKLSELLYVQQFRVINANDGSSALKILEQYPEIKLLIINHDLKDLDGYMLCQQLRGKYSKDQLAILGIASEKDRNIGIQFLKSGADDFIIRESFLVEEFYSRVRNCLETVGLYKQLHEIADMDFLTAAKNRKSFFDHGGKLVDAFSEKEKFVACIVIDIDWFKSINHHYGNCVGDLVLQRCADFFIQNGEKFDIVARLEGDTFGVIMSEHDMSDIVSRMEGLRMGMESSPLVTLNDGSQIYVTCSFGIRVSSRESLEEMLKAAKNKLKEAKEAGRNMIAF